TTSGLSRRRLTNGTVAPHNPNGAYAPIIRNVKADCSDAHVQRTVRSDSMTRIYIGTTNGLLILDDEDLKPVSSLFTGSTVESAVLDHANPGRIYVGFYSGQDMRGQTDPQTANGLRGVWRSDDGGETWQDCTAGLDQSAITSLAVRGEPGSYGTVYAG